MSDVMIRPSYLMRSLELLRRSATGRDVWKCIRSGRHCCRSGPSMHVGTHCRKRTGYSGYVCPAKSIGVDDTELGCVMGNNTISASCIESVHCTSILRCVCFSRPVSTSHLCCLAYELSCEGEIRAESWYPGENCVGGVRRSVGEFRMGSAAAL
jgi:hypothetical protein